MEFRRLLICVMDSFSSCNCTWSWWPAPVCFDKAVRKSESSSVLNRGFTVTKCLFSSQLSTNIRNSLCLFNLNFILPFLTFSSILKLFQFQLVFIFASTVSHFSLTDFFSAQQFSQHLSMFVYFISIITPISRTFQQSTFTRKVLPLFSLIEHLKKSTIKCRNVKQWKFIKKPPETLRGNS